MYICSCDKIHLLLVIMIYYKRGDSLKRVLGEITKDVVEQWGLKEHQGKK